MTPNLADLNVVPVTAHHTTVRAGHFEQGAEFVASCLCGWFGDPQPNAVLAGADARAHEEPS